VIYPTKRAIAAMAIGIPVTLILAMIAPNLWPIGAAWTALIACLIAIDHSITAKADNITVDFSPPPLLYIDDTESVFFDINFTGKATPKALDLKLATGPLLSASPEFSRVKADSWPLKTGFNITTVRRGNGIIEALWARWRGPLGLVWVQRVYDLKSEVPILPNSKYVTQEALRFFSQDAAFGQKIQLNRGEGTEFDSLREFVAGMDKRAIDWKQSARHRRLEAKEFRTERNHNIIFAIDTGRLMCEPLSGVPRIDRALNASLLMSYICLKVGDKVGFFGFDAAPRVYAKPVSGLSGFPQLLKQTAKIDYSIEETNFTLGLSQLGRTLSRRSLIVIFTDFVDTTNAELMVENVARLIKTHLVVFVTFNDVVLEDYMDADPRTPQHVTRAVIAASLSKDREIVLAKLRRMGVQILEADIDTIGIALLNTFFDLKRRGMI
jgi:uncharacterized protein (DUF58 family)